MAKKNVDPEKLHGAAKWTYQTYTIDKGPEEHDALEQSKGMLKYAGAIAAINAIFWIIDKATDKIANRPIKALKTKKDEESPC